MVSTSYSPEQQRASKVAVMKSEYIYAYHLKNEDEELSGYTRRTLTIEASSGEEALKIAHKHVDETFGIGSGIYKPDFEFLYHPDKGGDC